LFFENLARYLDPDQNFYVVLANRLDSLGSPFKNLYHLASCYVDQMSALQPKGPFYICGRWGPIVLEVGQQLLMQGKEVALTMVFDNVAPSLPTPIGKRRVISRFAGKLLRNIKSSPAIKSLPATVQNQRFARHAKRSKPSPARAMNNKLCEGYIPKKYPGKIVFIRSEEFTQRQSKQRHLSSWQALTNDLEVHITPGTHHTMWETTHAQNLSRLIQDLIRSSVDKPA
jgi:thioesterase domain-containing protein